MARMHLGQKYVSDEAIERWKHERGYDLPLFLAPADQAEGLQRLTRTIFFSKSVGLFALQFGQSDGGRDIGFDISERMWVSLAIAAPIMLVGLLTAVTLALLLTLLRSTWFDTLGVIVAVVMMSISSLFYIIAGQFLMARLLKLVPISGYDPEAGVLKFLLLPVLIGVVYGLGSNVRWYRTLFLEEMGRDYVRTARAKGLSELQVLFRHVLKNAMVPILTGVVVLLPLLFIGSLVLESFFAIPGLGSYTIEAIRNQDFAIVRAMVFLGSVLYIVGLLLTDLSYTLVDPRIRLG